MTFVERYVDLLLGPAGAGVERGDRLVLLAQDADADLLGHLRDRTKAIGASIEVADGATGPNLLALREDGGGRARDDGIWSGVWTTMPLPRAVGDDETLARLLRLDEPDPTASWLARHALLHRRAEALDAERLDRLRFVYGERELVVPLAHTARWLGPRGVTTAGRHFAPNLPCEEIFTAPHAYAVAGRVRPTARVEGNEYEEIRFTAGRGTHRDHHCGEIALVASAESAVAATGRVFDEVVLDENATCHVAVGCIIPGTASPGDTTASPHVGMHLDIPFHVETVVGERDGREVPLIEHGRWVGPGPA